MILQRLCITGIMRNSTTLSTIQPMLLLSYSMQRSSNSQLSCVASLTRSSFCSSLQNLCLIHTLGKLRCRLVRLIYTHQLICYSPNMVRFLLDIQCRLLLFVVFTHINIDFSYHYCPVKVGKSVFDIVETQSIRSNLSCATI